MILEERSARRARVLVRPATAPLNVHHPAFRGWEPGPRCFVEGLANRPIDWVGARLLDLDALLEQAGMATIDVGTGDAGALRQAVPEII
ncbi:MAG: hypothetical protein ABR615_03475 [Pseudonocardiaceae bacterium]